MSFYISVILNGEVSQKLVRLPTPQAIPHHNEALTWYSRNLQIRNDTHSRHHVRICQHGFMHMGAMFKPSRRKGCVFNTTNLLGWVVAGRIVVRFGFLAARTWTNFVL